MYTHFPSVSTGRYAASVLCIIFSKVRNRQVHWCQLKSSDSQDTWISNKRTWVKKNSRILETQTCMFRKHQCRWRREQRCREEKEQAGASDAGGELAGTPWSVLISAQLKSCSLADGLLSAPPHHADLLIFVAESHPAHYSRIRDKPKRDISVPSPPLVPLPTFFSLFSSGLSCFHLMLRQPHVT